MAMVGSVGGVLASVPPAAPNSSSRVLWEPSADSWHKLSSSWYYEKIEVVNELGWHAASVPDFFDKSIIAVAPFGGPIAAVRNENVLQASSGDPTAKLETFSAMGTLLGSCPWPWRGLVCLEWTADETLVAIFQDGVVRCFTPNSIRSSFFTMSSKFRNEGGVIRAVVAHNIIVVVTATLQLYVNSGYKGSSCTRLEAPGDNLPSPPLALCVIPATGSGTTNATPAPTAHGGQLRGGTGVDGGTAAGTDTTDSGGIPHADGHKRYTVSSSSNAVVAAGTGSSTVGIVGKHWRLVVCTEASKVLLYSSRSLTWTQLYIEGGPFADVVLSPTGNLLVFLSDLGLVKVFNVNNFNKPVEMANVDSRRKPKQVAWLADDCVAVYWALMTPSNQAQHIVVIGGPNDNWLPFQYSTPLHLISEVDSLRVLTHKHEEIIRRVPRTSDRIFSIGSCDPSALLCYALGHFDTAKAAAGTVDDVEENYLRPIALHLEEAIASCLDAALFQWKPNVIATLLRACIFGREFLGDTSRPAQRDFIAGCRDLRVVLTLRQSPAEMPITVAQLRAMGYPALLNKLTKRPLHLLALRIASYVGASTNGIVTDWCNAQIIRLASQTNTTDDELEAMVIDKLKHCTDDVIPYTELAYTAALSGRPKLASSLLKFESTVSAQVTLLLKLADMRPAMIQSLIAHDYGLLVQCVEAILAQEQCTADGMRDLSVLTSVVDQNPIADAFVRSYCRQTNAWSLLQRYLEQSKRPHEAGWMAVWNAFYLAGGIIKKQSADTAKGQLAFAAAFFGAHSSSAKRDSGGNFAAMRPSITFAHRATVDHIELLSAQGDLERKSIVENWKSPPLEIVGFPLFRTIVEVIARGHLPEAQKLRQNFLFSEKCWFQARLEGFVMGGDFHNLEILMTPAKRGGLLSCLQICLRYRNGPYAARIIQIASDAVPRLTDVGERRYWANQFNINLETLPKLPPQSGDMDITRAGHNLWAVAGKAADATSAAAAGMTRLFLR